MAKFFVCVCYESDTPPIILIRLLFTKDLLVIIDLVQDPAHIYLININPFTHGHISGRCTSFLVGEPNSTGLSAWSSVKCLLRGTNEAVLTQLDYI